METVMYMRVSGDTQVKGDGFPRQRLACEKYAAANGLQIVGEYRDEGVTGKMELENREGLSACIDFVRESGIKLVLVEDATRLARDLIVAEVIIREFQRAEVRVVSASGGVDLTAGDDSNPTAKLVRQILSAVAEFDRCVINLKLQGARARKRANDPDYHEGRVAFGLLDGEDLTLGLMRKLRGEGLGYQAITDALNAAGYPTRLGKAWTVGAVHKILMRQKRLPCPHEAKP